MARGHPGLPAVSVIVPTYQRRELVARAVASAFAQTFTEWELIVVDDGSTDGTREALIPLQDRLTYRWQPNRGVSAARNAALRLARAPIVAFLDSDDRWLPDHLAVLTAMLHRHPDALLASTCPRHAIRGRAGVAKAYIFDPPPLLNSAGYASCVAVRRDALLAAGGFDERMPVSEDAELFARLGRRGEFCLLQRRTVVRGHTSGLMAHGRRSGLNLDMFEYRCQRLAAELEASRKPGAAALRRQAQGGIAFARALQALETGDEPVFADLLEQACESAPDLATQGPYVVWWRLCTLPRSHVPAERLRHLVTAARLWPDPGADTALLLRVTAAVLALRQGRLRLAVRLMAVWPLRCTAGFVRRTLPGLAWRAHQGRDPWRHRTEPVDRFSIQPRVAVQRAVGE